MATQMERLTLTIRPCERAELIRRLQETPADRNVTVGLLRPIFFSESDKTFLRECGIRPELCGIRP